ncbi:MAG TPA: amino acid adenylation domain-containing protein, partial [Pyrinomonadaceae bacterium]
MQKQVSGFRLSPQQRRVWSLHNGGAPYLALCGIRLDGPLDREALREALRQVVGRHEILRTAFRRAPGVRLPLQVIADDCAPAWQDLDLAGAGEAEQARRVEELFEQEQRRQFDFEQCSPVRASLVRLRPERHLLLVCLPALCADALTLNNLARELGGAYASAPHAVADDGPMQYVQFSEWQNELLEDEEEQEGRDYWRRQNIADLLGAALPFENRGAGENGFETGTESLPLDAETFARLGEVARAHGTTVPTLLLACWQALLRRLTGQERVLVGTFFEGRQYEELRGAMGLFGRWLPVPADLPEEATFAEALARTHAAVNSAADFQEYFIWDDVAGDAGAAAALFFPFGFEYAQAASRRTADGLTFSVARQRVRAERFKLKLSCVELDGALALEFDYDRGRYRAEAVARLAGQFRQLLRSAVDEPRRAVGGLRMLSPDERRQILSEWNETAADFPRDKCLHELFEEQAARTPESVAVVFRGAELSYAELNRRADRLADYLNSSGVGADALVGLFMERSPELAVGLLGVLKAGAAYLPLDPAYPQERLRFMLEDAGAGVVLTQGRLAGRLPAHAGRVISLDAEWEAVEGQGAVRDRRRGATPQNLAYVIYTSGSTGRPKGVMIPHRGLVNYLHWCARAYRVAEGEGAPVHSPVGFDLTVTSLFSPLLTGRRVLLVEEGDGIEPLADALRAGHDFSLVKITPAHLEALAHSLRGAGGRPAPKALVIGGEALFHESLAYWREHAPDTRLVNEYGPTETVVGCAVHEVGAGGGAGGAVPIGRPIANTQLYVLDRFLEPAAAGVTGELYVGGEGLARGYLGRPGATAERFVPHPFSQEPGARLYRTGDLARHLPDGELEFIGRADEQVKIRGYRIELGEIEAVLSEHEVVREAVVVAREEAGGERRLVAYFVTAGGQEADAAELRAHLRGRLPEYMVPSAFVQLDEMPLTPNGKVDRRALPAPGQAGAGKAGLLAPRTAVEEILVGIWNNVLRVGEVGVNANFFELGGHSLLATQLMVRVRESFGVEILLRDFFNSPTVGALAELVEREMRAGVALIMPPLEPAAREAEVPLSFAQQRLWFLDQLEPDSPAYNIPVAVRLSGRLDHAALERALGEVVRRHEALRAVFPAADGKPVQRLDAPGPVNIALRDMRHLPAAEREAEARRMLQREAVRPFDLSRGPLLRAALWRLEEEEHLALLVLHHIVSDGWSMGVLVRELGLLYEAFAQGRPSPLPELPIQYGDFAHWQRGWLQGPALEGHLAYWREQLDGAATLELPTDHPRPAVQTFRGARHDFLLDGELTAAVRDLSRQEGATLFMTLLAAFQTLLWRYTQQDDISVGTPVAGRTHAELENLVGFFVNTLVLRARPEGGMSVRQLLRHVREVCLGAYAHQDVPFEKLVDELRPTRDLSHTPLFQVMLVMQNTPVEAVELKGLRMQAEAFESGVAKFDLTLEVEERGGQLRCRMEYNRELFEAETVRRLCGHFEQVLGAMARDAGQRISELGLLTEGERRRLLVEWNETARDYPRGRLIHELFAAQAGRTPEGVALVRGDEELTYSELNRRANRLAHYLRRLGAGPETCVGVLTNRTAEMVVCLLGILKAGAAYVPLDPAYPQARLSFMLDDTQMPVLITERDLRGLLPEHPARVLCLEDEREQIAGMSDDDPDRRAGEQNLAYVIYTSGSTGRPKGVQIEHRSAVTLINWAQEVFSPDELRGVLASTSICFDLSVFELFVPLSCGGRVLLADNALQLPALRAAEQVTLINTVPSAMAELARTGGVPASVRVVNLAGEPLKLPLATQVYEREHVERLFNLYGPSEDTTYSTCAPVGRGGVRQPSIGRPVANTQLYVLDPAMRPVPVGVRGEIYLGGEGLARGYLGRPGATAERFVPHPFSQEPGARLYRTGDLGRYLPDGEVEFLGRMDHQVKVRGFRIELGEIESALAAHEGIGEAVVMAREEAGGRKQLVAYVVAAPGREVDAAELRGHLRERLPEYMVPAAFVQLDEMPLTPNGKVDRRALPAPGQAGARASQDYREPRTAAERTLAAIWEQVLGVGRVGLDDNFFELGGDSIISIQIVARANGAGLRLTPRQLFQHQTVAELAAAAAEAPAVAAAEQGPVTGESPLTPAQRAFFERGLDEPHHYNHALLLRAGAQVEAARLSRAVRAVLAHHDALRSRFVGAGESRRQVFDAPHDGDPLEVVDLSPVPEAEQGAALEAAAGLAQRGLDLARGPLARFILFDRGAGREARLLVVIHHLVVDGVSWRILLEDLHSAYAQAAEGHDIVLPPKTTPFRRWAEGLAEYARGGALASEAAYWLDDSRRAVAPLPVDVQGGENTFGVTGRVTVSLEAEETRALLQEVPGVYRTRINDVLLAAVAAAVGGWSGAEEVLLELEGHGREEGLVAGADLTRTVGWFTALFPVLLPVGPGGGPASLLKSVKERLRAVPGGGLGYGLLRYLAEDPAVRGQLAALPQPELTFNYLGQLDQVLGGDGDFSPAHEPHGAPRAASERRPRLLEVNAHVAGGRLRVAWEYSERVHRRQTVERLAESFLAELRALISHCLGAGAGGRTPSDFPLAALTQRQLDSLLRERPEAEDIYALSPVQQGMLFHSLFAPHSGVYVNYLGWGLRGEFD